MKYRRLGRTGLAVSPISLGTMGFGPPASTDDVARLVHTALDLGINVLDTANCYDGPERGDIVAGHAESMLGEVLLPKLRDEFVLISKVGVPLRPGPQHRGLSATHILRELDNSLRRLATDYLDVYMIHWPDAYSHVEEVLRAIDQSVFSGKVRYFGISNHQAWQVGEYLWTADRRNWPAAAVSEIPRSLLDRRYENDLPFYERHEIGVVGYQPLMGGLLTNRGARNEEAPSAKGDAKIAGWRRTVLQDMEGKLAELRKVAANQGLSLSELAIAWALLPSAISSVVLGARSVEQLTSGLAATECRIPTETLEQLDYLCPPPPPPQPRFER
ncbi:MAG TPA: aldo/keto reductase [Lacipirellulaceae bacterium]|nr:aldo/keto reductase [Lacipirellulaceae bacterium]